MRTRELMVKYDAVLSGEFFFALKSGKVATTYLNVDPLLTYYGIVRSIGSDLMKQKVFYDSCTALAGPAVGSIPFIYAAATSLGINNPGASIRTAFPEKQAGGTFRFERMKFAKAMQGQRVVVVEDILTTGDSAKATVDLVREAGGTVIGVSAIWNRGGVTKETFDVPILHTLIDERIPTWVPGQHEMWGKWPLVADVGHPEHFPDYTGGTISLLPK